MRRVLIYENIHKIPSHVLDAIIHDIVHEYGEFYPELLRENETIRKEFQKERNKFVKTITIGYEEFKKRLNKKGTLDTLDVFDLHQTFGLNKEQSLETIKQIMEIISDSVKHGVGKTIDFNESEFESLVKKHKEISRAGQEKKFGGHGLLLDTGELKAADEEELKKVTRLHTATHLLNAALRKALCPQGFDPCTIEQRGSDITVERTRFDFLFPRKLTADEIQKIENFVNYTLSKNFFFKKKNFGKGCNLPNFKFFGFRPR